MRKQSQSGKSATTRKSCYDKFTEVTITDFLSYREYLDACYKSAKQALKSYSYAQFAEDLGLSKSNVLWLVVSGRRKLTKNTSQKIIKNLKLTGTNRRYFESLIEYNNAIRPDRREAAFQALIGLKSSDLDTNEQQQTLEYFAEWYHPVIRELVGLADFQDDPEWIAEKLLVKVLPKDIRASLDLLQGLGLIAFDEVKGRLVQTGGQVHPDRKVGSIAAVRYHQKICEIAKESITRVPSGRRDFNAITLNLSEEAAMKLSERLYKVCEEVMAFEESTDNPDQVFQVNIQLFPYTKKRKSE